MGRPAEATPKLMDICCIVLAMELALLVCYAIKFHGTSTQLVQLADYSSTWTKPVVRRSNANSPLKLFLTVVVGTSINDAL